MSDRGIGMKKAVNWMGKIGLVLISLMVVLYVALPFGVSKLLHMTLEKQGYENIVISTPRWSKQGIGFYFPMLKATNKTMPQLHLEDTKVWVAVSDLLDHLLTIHAESLLYKGSFSCVLTHHFNDKNNDVVAELNGISLSLLLKSMPQDSTWMPKDLLGGAGEGVYSMQLTGQFDAQKLLQMNVEFDLKNFAFKTMKDTSLRLAQLQGKGSINDVQSTTHFTVKTNLNMQQFAYQKASDGVALTVDNMQGKDIQYDVHSATQSNLKAELTAQQLNYQDSKSGSALAVANMQGKGIQYDVHSATQSNLEAELTAQQLNYKNNKSGSSLAVANMQGKNIQYDVSSAIQSILKINLAVQQLNYHDTKSGSSLAVASMQGKDIVYHVKSPTKSNVTADITAQQLNYKNTKSGSTLTVANVQGNDVQDDIYSAVQSNLKANITAQQLNYKNTKSGATLTVANVQGNDVQDDIYSAVQSIVKATLDAQQLNYKNSKSGSTLTVANVQGNGVQDDIYSAAQSDVKANIAAQQLNYKNTKSESTLTVANVQGNAIQYDIYSAVQSNLKANIAAQQLNYKNAKSGSTLTVAKIQGKDIVYHVQSAKKSNVKANVYVQNVVFKNAGNDPLITLGKLKMKHLMYDFPSSRASLGELSLKNIAAIQPKANKDTLASLNEVKLMHVSVNHHQQVSIDDVLLSQGSLKAVKNKDTSWNGWQTWLASFKPNQAAVKASVVAPTTPKPVHQAQAVDASKKASVAAASIQVHNIHIVNVDVKYVDLSKNPEVHLPIMIQDFSMQDTNYPSSTQYAHWKAHGRLLDLGVWQADGTASLANVDAYSNTHLVLKDINLPPFSGYTMDKLGKMIQSGNMDVTLNTRIRDGELKAEGHFFARKINFKNMPGVSKPQDYLMPWDSTLDVLRDSNDNIKLNISSEGKLDDPSFRLGGIWDKILFQAAQRSALYLIGQALQPYGLLLTAGQYLYDQSKRIHLKPMIFPMSKTALATATPKIDSYAKKIVGLIHEKPTFVLEICPIYTIKEGKDGLALSKLRVQELKKYMTHLGLGASQMSSCLPSLDDKKNAEPRLDLRLI